MEWFGGKPAGCLSVKDTYYQVIFSIGKRNEQNYMTKSFSTSTFSTLENALKVAKEWREETSLELGLTKNLIRIVENKDEEPYLEVQMQNDLVMKCDIKDLEIVENSIWTAWKPKGKKCWYARRRPTNAGQTYAMFHTLICPDYSQIDHINRDGLDNRRSNLRNGEIVNAKNKGIQINNKSGTSGVYYKQGENSAWCVQIGGKQNKKSKTFSIKKYGHDKALELAINTRKEWEKVLNYGH